MSSAKEPGSGPVEGLPPSHDSRGERSASAFLWLLSRVIRRLATAAAHDETLRGVAEEALPHLGSWCIVDIVEQGGTQRRLAVIHHDPDRRPHAQRLTESWPPVEGDPMGVPRALLSRRAELIPKVDEEMLVRMARSETNLRDLRALGVESAMVAPLIARDTVMGAITFVAGDRGQIHRETDLRLAEDLALLCAIALVRAPFVRDVERIRGLAEHLNTVSHEIRTPVNAILGYVALLADEVAGPITEAQRKHLDRIREGGHHLTALLSDLLESEEIRERGSRLELEQAPMRPVVLEALNMIRPLAHRAGITLALECDRVGGGGWYVGDEKRVRQILLNLFSNAVKFTDPGGRVRATCGTRRQPYLDASLPRDGPWTFAEVTDSGIGIPDDKLEAVFDRFVQLESGRRGGEAGTGLGLTISRDLARRMGGDLTVRSQNGGGSSFTLWLPAA